MLTEKWPALGRREQAETWLTIWTDLGRAPRTIDAYARGLAEQLVMREREDVDPVTAHRAHIAVYVRQIPNDPHATTLTSYFRRGRYFTDARKPRGVI